jgi:hypothetical protein
MQTFKAEQGLLVCWGGFNKVVLAEARQGHFTVRLWDSRDVVEAVSPASEPPLQRCCHAAPLHSCKYRWLHAPATI